MLRVTNRSRRPFEVNLRRGVDYGIPHESTFEMTQPVVLPGGENGQRIVSRVLPGSLRWGVGEVRVVPDAVAKIPEFRAARDAGILLVVQVS